MQKWRENTKMAGNGTKMARKIVKIVGKHKKGGKIQNGSKKTRSVG
jgi:hypothetical protein